MTFRIEITWHNINNMTSLDIDFHFIYLLSKALHHHIYGTINSNEKTLYIA